MKLIPHNYDHFPNASDGERLLCEGFQSASKGANWTVLHSLELARHVNQSQGECDFVILAPGHGVLVLEVKAARSVSRDANGWKLGRQRSTKGPFKQAKDAMFSIRAFLEDEGVSMHNVPFVYDVWFTHISAKSIPTSAEWTDAQVLTEEDRKHDLVSFLSERIDALVDELGFRFSADKAGVQALQAIETALSPRFTATQAPVRRQRDIEKFLQKALDEQLERVELALSLPKVLLQGPAGTGKTFIATHAARLAQESKQSTLMVCFNHLLAEQLKSELSSCPSVKVSSLHALMLEVADVEPPDHADHTWWAETLPDLAMKNVDEARQSFGFTRIIIDEAQDIGTEEYLLFLDSISLNGLQGCEVLVCADFTNQSLFTDGEDSRQHFLSAIPELATPKPLVTNCRNTKEVGQFIEVLVELTPGYGGFRQDEADGEVQIIEVTSNTEIASQITPQLRSLLTRYEPEHIVILSSRIGPLEQLLEKSTLQLSRLKNPKPRTVRWGSISEFKGLEAMAIVHVEFDGDHVPTREAIYVAGTRSLNDYVWIVPAQIKQAMVSAT